MIQSYKEEVTSRRNKAAIFWFVVFVFSGFLYLFFQGYYLNLDLKDIKVADTKPSNILKQFWIIKMQVFPEPQEIYIDKVRYWNWDKKILDYWFYPVEIYSSWSIPVNFDIEINKDHPIFYETINQFKRFKYHKLDMTFDELYKVDDYYLWFIKKDKTVNIINNKFKLINVFKTDFMYIWYKYFSDNWYIYYYDSELNLLKPYTSKDTKLWLYCSNARTYHDRLFCYDHMDFIDWSEMKWEEKVLRINNNLILTENYIYNNWNWWDWWTYPQSWKFTFDPSNLVHINKMPYLIEDGLIYQMDKSKKIQFKLPWIDIIKNSYSFWNETVLVWYRWQDAVFLLIDDKRIYSWVLDNKDISKTTVNKYNWIYLFNTWNRVFLYYKWSPKLLSILSWNDIKFIEDIAFFKKDSKNYYLKLSEE